MMLLLAAAASSLAAGVGGCTTSGSEPSAYDAARGDPMNYQGTSQEWPDVSGGGIGHFDKKAFNRDLNNVFNP